MISKQKSLLEKETILQKPYGWIKLFWILFVLTSVGAVITGPGSIEGLLYTNFEFNPFIGYPEITLQMLTFSWLFSKWQNKWRIQSWIVLKSLN